MKDLLIKEGFSLENYPDGNFWVLRAKGQNELFIQVNEDYSDISLYEFGWVENGLTKKEFKKALSAVKNYESSAEEEQ